jgi:MbtH protein
MEDDQIYLVVTNDEEQYSIWAEARPIPAGWSAEGFRGPRQACLDHIDEVWTDMRPLSLRRDMALSEGNPR